MLTVFAAANVFSFFARSDDLFTPDMPDAMTRFGFPFLVFQDGGPVALCFFSHPALCGDIALAVVSSIGFAAFSRASAGTWVMNAKPANRGLHWTWR
jgi:hypothetical protein